MKPIKIEGFPSYMGGKGGTGTPQAIINCIPKHKLRIIPFLGNCAITRHISNCEFGTIAMDLDDSVILNWRKAIQEQKLEGIVVEKTDAIKWLHIVAPEIHLRSNIKPKEIFMYCDPPYIINSRKSQRHYYAHEMSDNKHERFLELIKKLPFNIAISHYDNDMYNEALQDWHKTPYKSWTRQGIVDEILYHNYKKPTKLHDYTYVGKDYRERQHIKNKIKRHVARLKSLPALERNAILTAMANELAGLSFK